MITTIIIIIILVIIFHENAAKLLNIVTNILFNITYFVNISWKNERQKGNNFKTTGDS